jgi:FtsP/CotA-like multicopper oxidase with cupredoxin domain
VVRPRKATSYPAFERFIGQFVLHCHILGHEDLGMMMLVEIAPPGTVPA